jgi:hypothetical protein
MPPSLIGREVFFLFIYYLRARIIQVKNVVPNAAIKGWDKDLK